MAGPFRVVLGFVGRSLLVVALLMAVGVVLFQSGLIGESVDSASSDEPLDGEEPGERLEPGVVPEEGQEPADGGARPIVAEGTQPVELIRVIDGDSLELEIDGVAVDVRIGGVNAPELFGNDGRTCNGVAAKAALVELVDGRRLLISGAELDRFGRRLGDVLIVSDPDSTDGQAPAATETDGNDAGTGTGTVTGLSVAFALVESGNALSTADAPNLRETMKDAAAAGRGLWGDRCGPRGPSMLVLGDTQVDPPGSDRDNLNDEWVTVVNEGDDTVDLVGWVISDDTTGHRFDLDGELGPGERLFVRSGTGGRSDVDFYLNESFPVWSNAGETVLLTDPDGVVSTWRFIDP